MHTDKNGREVKVGDTIRMPIAPMFPVTVKALVDCEARCPHGAAAIVDPETGEPDEVCLGDFEVV